MNNNIWIISELFYPETTSTGYFITGIAEFLAHSLQVNVLCNQPTYWMRDTISPKRDIYRGINIHRCRGTTYNKDVLPLRIINMVTFAASIFQECMMSLRAGDCVFVVTNPPVLPFVVSCACRLRGTCCVLVVHDVYPEAMVASGILSKGSLLTKGIASLSTSLYKKVQRIVVLGRDMASLVRAKLFTGEDRVVIIPHWADLDFVHPLPRQENTLLSHLGLARKFVVQYSGNIGRTHGIEDLADCAEGLLHDRDIHFLFIGFGGKRKWLDNRIRERNLVNSTLIDYRPRADLPVSLNACDVAIVSFVKGMVGVSVPSRMYNIMAAGKPIIAIADGDSELARVVAEENIGWVISPGDNEMLRKVIIEAKNSPGLLADMGKRARQAAEAKYSYEAVNRAYMDLIISLTRGSLEFQ